MADNADAIARVLTGQSKQLAGAVRITAVQTVAGHLLPPILARLRAQEPGIAIEVVASNAISLKTVVGLSEQFRRRQVAEVDLVA